MAAADGALGSLCGLEPCGAEVALGIASATACGDRADAGSVLFGSTAGCTDLVAATGSTDEAAAGDASGAMGAAETAGLAGAALCAIIGALATEAVTS